MSCSFLASQCINIPGPIAGTANQSSFTISFWMRLNALPTVDNMNPIAYANGTTGLTRIGVNFRSAAPGTIRIIARALDGDALTSFETVSTTALTPGLWQHVLTTVNYVTGTGQIFVNAGSLAVAGASAFGATATSNTSSLNAKIGATSNNNATELFNGLLEDIRLYRGVMGQNMIDTIFAGKGKDGIYTNLIQRYQLKELGEGRVFTAAYNFGDAEREVGTNPTANTLLYGDSMPTTRKRPRHPVSPAVRLNAPPVGEGV